jgi:hypothetical protein
MTIARADLARTIEELEGEAWGPPEFNSYVVEQSYRLRQVPLGQLSVENLRLLVGQQVGFPWLLERAVQVLETNPLAEGDFYEGDLLAAVLALPSEVLAGHPHVVDRLRQIVDQATPILRRLASAGPGGAESDLLSSIARHFPGRGAA